MIKGMGIDLVEISRMTQNVQNAHFMRRVFSDAERAHIGTGNLAAERAAGNFAAKEALGKALGCGIAGCPMDSVEVLRDEAGAPYINATGAAKEKLDDLGVWNIQVSITHTGETAAAVVVLEGD